MKNAHVNIWSAFFRISLFFLLLISLTAVASSVKGQIPGRIMITPPDIAGFPQVTFYLEAYNSQGAFISDLRSDELQILEDGHIVQGSELSSTQPGLQVIIAINNSPTYSSRIGEYTFFDYIQQTLTSWAQMMASSSPDDFSLSTNTGLVVVREKDRSKWLQSLAGYQPDLLTAAPSLVSLTQSLDMATDPNPAANMKRAILFITPPLDEESLAALPNLASRSEELGLRIFVWLVDTAGVVTPEVSNIYSEFVRSCGGEMLIFTGNEALPNPDIYFEPLRILYKINYTSGANQSGDHNLVVSINRPDLQLDSGPQSFYVMVQPPNPIFLDPPTQVIRSWLLPKDNSSDPLLIPEALPISVMIEFPDNYLRQIKSLRLYVDGNLAAENKIEPFDKITWPLALYQDSGTHLLRVEVEDILGLKQSSIETAIEVVVEPLKRSVWDEIFSGDRILFLIALLVTAFILLVALFLTGRWTFLSQLKKRSQMKNDPLTQPVAIRQDTPRGRLSAAAHTPTVPRSLSGLSAPARFVRLSDSGHPIPSSAIPLNYRLCTFGNDPQQATIVLDSTSVDALHTRLSQTSDGEFVLSDANSVAGTWVNYTPVSDAGVHLQHGDTIHIGRVAFRFEISVPPPMQAPKVTKT